MADMLCRTNKNINPQGKPRVYFTCHPEDFDTYFDKVCQDIFSAHSCVIYYTEDMTASISEEDLSTDLGSNNVFVIPVTRKLLTEPNRAMDHDFQYAKKEHIPVLPIMMESGIDDIYMQPDKFGTLQYLNPYSTDATEIAFKEKLHKYLESVLISDETAKRVRAAFDAYIFLSYRKKDRNYANKLMRLIHQNPVCRDIAIWFDEFLTPGESFRDNIDKILHDSKLFALLVTPSLLEETDGKPNFVVAEEYPAAKASGIEIFPAEMESTDKAALSEKFQDLPDCVDVSDENAFHQQFLDALQKAAITTNDTDPEHIFLMGLAYLKGIDVEVDRQRGIELITSAAESKLPEAMEQLYNMYLNGWWVPLNYSKAAHWLEALVDYHKETSGENHPTTLVWIDTLSFIHIQLGNYEKAHELASYAYLQQVELFDIDHPDCISTLNHIAISCDELGDYERSLYFKKAVYQLQCEHFGEEDPTAITFLSNLSLTHNSMGNPRKALPLAEKAYELHCKVLGEEHPDTLRSLSNLAITYRNLRNHKKCVELNETAYTLRCKTLGEAHPYTMNSLNNLAVAYCDLGDYEKSLELNTRAYELYYNILGEEHPNTLRVLSNLALNHYRLGDYQKSLQLQQSLYAYRRKVLGEKHPDTHAVLTDIAHSYIKMDDLENAITYLRQLLTLQQNAFGASHAETLDTMSLLGEAYVHHGKRRKGLSLIKMAYISKSSILGDAHPKTISSMVQLANAYKFLGKDKKAAEINEKIHALRNK